MTVQERYNACYQQIAQDHIEYAKANQGGNPFMPHSLVEHLEQATEEIVRRHVTPGALILDAGCGTGSLLRRLDSYQREGVDLSDDYIAYARQHVPGVKFWVENLERLPRIWFDSFDAVVCTSVLEHVLDEHAVLRELTRVLKPGGHLIVRVPDGEDMSPYTGTSVTDVGEYAYTHLRRFDAPTLRILLQKIHGLHVEEIDPVGAHGWKELHAVAVTRKP